LNINLFLKFIFKNISIYSILKALNKQPIKQPNSKKIYINQ